VQPRALLLTSRFPWPVITGDRIRALAWLEALSPRAHVTLVAPAGIVPAGAPACDLVPARRSPLRLPGAAARVVRKGLPLTSLLAAGYDWRGALRSARERGGPFDVAIVLLARLDPWVYGALDARQRIFDAIDSLAANLAERAQAARGPARWAWADECRRTARLEADAASRYERTLVVAETERAAFGARATAVFHGVEIAPLGESPRPWDVGFWGRLAYFANRDAVRLLLEQIWPRVRAARPDATLVVAGADAPAFVRRHDGSDGITVMSPMTDRGALLRQVRVALFPLRYGSGQSNKVLEAGEAGCALVATPQALRALDALAEHAFVAEAASDLAEHTLALLAAPAAAGARGRGLRALVERDFSREHACRRLAAIALGDS
jgi:hypothetical protein